MRRLGFIALWSNIGERQTGLYERYREIKAVVRIRIDPGIFDLPDLFQRIQKQRNILYIFIFYTYPIYEYIFFNFELRTDPFFFTAEPDPRGKLPDLHHRIKINTYLSTIRPESAARTCHFGWRVAGHTQPIPHRLQDLNFLLLSWEVNPDSIINWLMYNLVYSFFMNVRGGGY